MRSILAICTIPALLLLNPAQAKTWTLTKTLENYCSAGLEQLSFTCGSPDLGYYNGHTDLNKNGVYDILEVGRTFTIDLALPPPPDGYEYRANGPATIRLDTFGDLDSYPDLPARVEDISATEHYDIEWIEVALDGYSLGRIFDGNLANDAFNMGVEQDWWGDKYDRGSLWEKVVYGSATIPQDVFTNLVSDGKLSTSFGLAHDHNDLTGHPYFDNREEFITVTISFDADLVPASTKDRPPVATFTVSSITGNAPLNVGVDASASRDSEGSISQFDWDFGDGAKASGKTASHVYDKAGRYTITLEVTDSSGQTATSSREITVKTGVVNTPPKASFAFSPNNGTAPVDVDFDASASTDAEGPISRYQWQFEAGKTGSGKTPKYRFTKAGSYPVKLTVTDDKGLSHSVTQTVTVKKAAANNAPPVAAFSYSPTTGKAPLTVNFDATRSSDPEGATLAHQWQFGDGATGSGKKTSHRFTRAGSYPVKLTVTDDKGLTGTTMQIIKVTAPSGNKAPLAVIDATPDNGAAPLEVRFSAARSSDSDGRITAWEWSFGDGASATTKNPVHRYAQAGAWKVSLTVIDDKGAKSSATKTITVSKPPSTGQTLELLPVADVGATDNHASPVLFIEKWDHGFLRFDLSSLPGNIDSAVLKLFSQEDVALKTTLWPASSDNWNDKTPTPVEIGYDYAGGKAIGTISHNTATYLEFPVTNFIRRELAGDKIASFEISNNREGWRAYASKEGSAPPLLVVTTAGGTGPVNASPVADFTLSPTSGTAPLLVSFDASGASDSDGSITGYRWAFGDGATSSGLTASHRYDKAGRYTIRLTVTDNNGASGSKTKTVVVTKADAQQPPVAIASVDDPDALAGQTLTFSSKGSSAPNSTISQWRWDFGDGSSATTANPSHAYSKPGVYSVTLTIQTANARSATTSIKVTVRKPAGQPVKTLTPVADLGATGVADSAALHVDAWDHAFLRFKLGQIDGAIASATLRLFINSEEATETRLWQARTDAWDEASDRPAEVGYPWIDAPLLGSISHAARGYLEFDLTPAVRAEAAGDGVLSIEVGNTSGHWLEYSSRESSHAPELVIR